MDNCSREELQRLEAIIRGAGGYVHPTDDLRPRILEAARERVSLLRGRRRVLAAAAVVFLLATLGLPFTAEPSSDANPSMRIVAATDIQRRVQQRAASGAVEPIWALYEAFASMRQTQAAHFDGAEVPRAFDRE